MDKKCDLWVRLEEVSSQSLWGRIFIDYVRMYDDTGFDYRAMDADIAADAWTLGVSYTF